MDCYTEKGNSLDLDHWLVMLDPEPRGVRGKFFPFPVPGNTLLIDIRDSRGLSFGGRRSIAAVVE